MKTILVLFSAIWAASLAAQAGLPLSFDLGVHPEAEGNLMDARVEWRWSERLASRASLSYASSSSSGDLEGYGEGALYASSTGDGSLVIEPFVLGGELGPLDWEAGAGLGGKTELMSERGTYQNVGTQAFDNQVSSWRVGPTLSGGLGARFGPVDLALDLLLWPASFYSLRQTQTSSLISPEGTLSSLCLIGPEFALDFRVSAFSFAWAGARYEFLWLSVPRLVQNEAGDAWASAIEGTTNQAIRLVGGLRLPVASGALELGLGWRRKSSAAAGGGEAELDQGLVFELSLSSGK